MGLNAISTTDHFDAFTKTLCVGYENVTLVLTLLVATWAVVVPWLLIPSIASLVDLFESFLYLVQSPFGIFALSENLPQVVLFLLEQLRLAANCFGPMGEGVGCTKFG